MKTFEIISRSDMPLGFMFLILMNFCVVEMSLAQHLEVEGHANILKMDTVLESPNNVVRLEDGTLALKHVQIGDTAFGGLIFYVDPSGEHGLVMAENDQSNSIVWSDTLLEVGSTSNGVYGGAGNAEIILATHLSGNYAARLCYDLNLNGYSDWYLPSYAELVLIDQNLHANGIGNLIEGAGQHYWSSTEFSPSTTHVRTIIFGNVIPFAVPKTIPLHVRAVRRF